MLHANDLQMERDEEKPIEFNIIISSLKDTYRPVVYCFNCECHDIITRGALWEENLAENKPF